MVFGAKSVRQKIQRRTKMKNRHFPIILILVSFAAFADDSPLTGVEFTESVTLNGQRFIKSQVAESWREQSGSAIIGDQNVNYWLYDTLGYHGGKSDEIYNRYIPSWVQKMGYIIDYDRIKTSDPNPNLASSVQALMSQKGCDVSVALIKYDHDYDYVVINEWFKSRSIYKTTVYPLHSLQAMDDVEPDHISEFLDYIWIGNDDSYIFTLYEPRR